MYLPSDVLNKVQTCFPLRERNVLPRLATFAKDIKPLVPSAKEQFDGLVELYGTSSVQLILHKAVEYNDENTEPAIKLAMSYGADIEGEITSSGISRGFGMPLHDACARNATHAIAVLLKLGANPNRQRPNTNWTPTMHMARSGSVDTLRTLVEGAARRGVKLDVNVVSPGLWRQTALDIAMRRRRRRGKDEMVAFLRNIGALTAKEIKLRARATAGSKRKRQCPSSPGNKRPRF